MPMLPARQVPACLSDETTDWTCDLALGTARYSTGKASFPVLHGKRVRAGMRGCGDAASDTSMLKHTAICTQAGGVRAVPLDQPCVVELAWPVRSSARIPCCAWWFANPNRMPYFFDLPLPGALARPLSGAASSDFGKSPITLLSGHTETTGHCLQLATIAIGQMVMGIRLSYAPWDGASQHSLGQRGSGDTKLAASARSARPATR